MDTVKEFIGAVSIFVVGIALVVGTIVTVVMFVTEGPHVFDNWELNYQAHKIDNQLKEKCLKDKYYCNPQNYNVEIK